ncbi:hypothetical protein HU200_035285 [Digitaria exilis]|uniref:Pentatricopeptide repeat-containing protein n=1 Tax=Digitaria exilis TaxID=1010633 RepID=A0A835BHY1_9POAL|nr:hypothetical protein HU200_035285 [Digitaria exilis]
MSRPSSAQAGAFANATFSHLFQLGAGRAAHARMLVSWFVPTAFVGNCLLRMYARCADAVRARGVFDAMPHRDTVSWNTMLTAYAHAGDIGTAVSLFDAIPDPDVVSWNTLISSYGQHDMFRESVGLFLEMAHHGVAPDGTTFAVLLKVCSGLEDPALGVQIHGLAVKISLKVSQPAYASAFRSCSAMPCLTTARQLHAHAIKNEFSSDLVVVKQLFSRICCQTIVDVYAKAGSLVDVRKAFFGLPNHTVEICNAMMVGLVRTGHGAEATQLFQFMTRSGLGFDSEEAQKFSSEMLDMGVKPDHFTYATVIDTCANLATTELGKQIHGQIIKQEMLGDEYISSTLVDMYAKCGNMPDSLLMFEKAQKLDFVSWNAMICGYALHGQGLQALEMIRKLMRQGRLKKEPGCSWIEVQSEMHGFLVGDKVHPRSREVYAMLNDLIGEMKLSGYEPASVLLAEVDEEGSTSEQNDLLGIVGE